MNPVWLVGVTTVKERRSTTLPRTLASLEAAGFHQVRLFVDDHPWDYDPNRAMPSGVTYRTPRVRAYGNWLLGLMELVIRNPLADYYAMFQDDFITMRNLRPYLEKCPYPRRGYWNLYFTAPNYPQLPTRTQEHPIYRRQVGWFRSNQRGLGAVATIFSQEVAYQFLSAAHTYTRMRDRDRGWQAIDGGIVTAMNHQGVSEFIHYPALVQHIGVESVMHQDSLGHPGLKPHNQTQPEALEFLGENWDALDFLKEKG